jgi:hypothetical protein
MPKSSNLSSRATILVVLLTIIGWVLVFSPSTVSAVKSVIVSPDATTVPLDTTIPILSTEKTLKPRLFWLKIRIFRNCFTVALTRSLRSVRGRIVIIIFSRRVSSRSRCAFNYFRRMADNLFKERYRRWSLFQIPRCYESK